MERVKLIIRTVYKEVPAKLEYELKEAGQDLMPLFQKIDACVRKHYA